MESPSRTSGSRGPFACPSFSDILSMPKQPEKTSNYNGRPGQQRAILTKEQAVRIYMYRKSAPFPIEPKLAGNATAVAALFQVNPKTVRDIWNRRTWTDETHHLWQVGDEPVMRSRRRQIKFGRRGSTSTSSVGSIEDRGEGFRTRSPSSSSSSCPSPSGGIDMECEQRLLTGWMELDECCNEAWQWECGSAPLCGHDDDPFRPDGHAGQPSLQCTPSPRNRNPFD
eukprot:CAMPEP_0113691848 /NCGR_PEP_ID=MMETSP0038_2-20120614/18721_1 /TAXON_ID=2898 /ORGANISM="Cryptomonas paramecium" /LENGTH=225 /DNA_ID=CAMNT_0000613623 /DNA_START=327 /DNA_END=1004 /DNA_ORIENTATION=- /assembly_acc=CAM_ASM_000170